MALNDTAKNVMLDALTAVATWAACHDADPGTTGTNELAGGTPAYARKAITWSAASGANADSSNTPVFDIEGGDTVAWVGWWSAVTAGVFYGSADVIDEVFGGQGTYTLTDADLSLT